MRRGTRLSQERRCAACDVLAASAERARSSVVASLDDGDPMLRAAAARSLGALRVEQALAPLVRRSSARPPRRSEGETERAALVDAIVALAGPDADGCPPAIAPRAVELLARALTGSGDETRLAAARGTRPDRAARGRRARGALDEGSERAGAARGRGCDRALEPDRTPELLHLAIADESPRCGSPRGARSALRAAKAVRRSAPAFGGRGPARARDGGAGGRRRFAADREPAIRAAALAC